MNKQQLLLLPNSSNNNRNIQKNTFDDSAKYSMASEIQNRVSQKAETQRRPILIKNKKTGETFCCDNIKPVRYITFKLISIVPIVCSLQVPVEQLKKPEIRGLIKQPYRHIVSSNPKSKLRYNPKKIENNGVEHNKNTPPTKTQAELGKTIEMLKNSIMKNNNTYEKHISEQFKSKQFLEPELHSGDGYQMKSDKKKVQSTNRKGTPYPINRPPSSSIKRNLNYNDVEAEKKPESHPKSSFTSQQFSFPPGLGANVPQFTKPERTQAELHAFIEKLNSVMQKKPNNGYTEPSTPRNNIDKESDGSKSTTYSEYAETESVINLTNTEPPAEAKVVYPKSEEEKEFLKKKLHELKQSRTMLLKQINFLEKRMQPSEVSSDCESTQNYDSFTHKDLIRNQNQKEYGNYLNTKYENLPEESEEDYDNCSNDSSGECEQPAKYDENISQQMMQDFESSLAKEGKINGEQNPSDIDNVENGGENELRKVESFKKIILNMINEKCTKSTTFSPTNNTIDKKTRNSLSNNKNNSQYINYVQDSDDATGQNRSTKFDNIKQLRKDCIKKIEKEINFLHNLDNMENNFVDT